MAKSTRPKSTRRRAGIAKSGAKKSNAQFRTGRYTPPVPKSKKKSSPILIYVIFALLGLGFLSIILNYLGILPGGATNWYLLAGLGLIAGGFVVATRYR